MCHGWACAFACAYEYRQFSSLSLLFFCFCWIIYWKDNINFVGRALSVWIDEMNETREIVLFVALLYVIGGSEIVHIAFDIFWFNRICYTKYLREKRNLVFRYRVKVCEGRASQNVSRQTDSYGDKHWGKWKLKK